MDAITTPILRPARSFRLGIGVLLLIGGLSPGCMGSASSLEEDLPENRIRGESVIKQLDRYRTETGKYPTELTEIEQYFGVDLPEPEASYPHWQYANYGESFDLCFADEEGGYPNCCYSSNSKDWEINQ